MNKTIISPDLMRQIFLIALILLSGYLITAELLPYLSGILGAITLFILFKGLMRKMLDKNFKPGLAAGIIIIISIFIVIIPLWLLIQLFISKIQKAIDNSEAFMNIIKDRLGDLENYIGYDIMANINTEAITSWVSKNAQNLVGSTFQIFVTLSIMYFLLYFMLIKIERFKEIFLQFIPVSDENMEIITHESTQIVKSNAIGIPLVAIMQGVVALVGYFIFGVSDPWFWFVVTVIGSMIPFIGTALGIVPVTVLLYADGNTFSAIGLLLYGAFVVGSTDNLFRMFVQNRMANLHPLITLIGVVIGIPLFGFLGLIFGPLLLSLFLLLLKIYKNEYVPNKSEKDIEKPTETEEASEDNENLE
ncbi:AI-2E family transporter [Robertkochia aurantiaca]|uniref:AI-2E family transporter n=1 Tax=Robertkochia aurantiaca TaxID=2873700 RepID=UPI001CC9EB4A|nr:AI-2E family transporter [Robertkochia sp. 3YJGBD-33]